MNFPPNAIIRPFQGVSGSWKCFPEADRSARRLFHGTYDPIERASTKALLGLMQNDPEYFPNKQPAYGITRINSTFRPIKKRKPFRKRKHPFLLPQ
jgi:hypothetical protein